MSRVCQVVIAVVSMPTGDFEKDERLRGQPRTRANAIETAIKDLRKTLFHNPPRGRRHDLVRATKFPSEDEIEQRLDGAP